MKAFLMFRDRDFDRQQILATDDPDFRFRQADREARLLPLLPWNGMALSQDLGLDILFNAMALGDQFLFDVARLGILSSVTDPDTIIYRQHVFKDCVKHEAIVREMYQIAIEAITRQRKDYLSFMSRYPSGILGRSVDVLQMFVGMLKRLKSAADLHAAKFESEGFSRLFAMLQQELRDDYFVEIEGHLNRLKFRHGVLISAQLGRGNKAANYVLRKPHKDKRIWIVRLLSRKPAGYTFRLHPRDENGARALGELRDQGVNLVANALAQSNDHILSFFQMLRTELAFYIGCLNLHRQLADLREPVCFPVPVQAEGRTLAFSELYDVCLALSKKQNVVANDLDARGKDIAIITGANTGGKSTFMRSVGLGQLMMQAGMFAPAAAFSANICDGVFTHFKREEDVAMESGKLDEELSRMSDIVEHITPNSLLLLNESFASTNEREGSEIARQIVSALAGIGIEIVFVTHLYEFARNLFDRKMPNAIFLRAQRLDDGTRTFKLVEGKPLQTSYGKDLYDAAFHGRTCSGAKAAS
jgi:DNA mismatch repair ATPase MutS